MRVTGPKGLITRIQGSSFVDGPGIRTTVFLKGCPLRCPWCCNPENQERSPEKNRLFPQKGASETFGEWMTAEHVIEDVVKKDIAFYRSSGGGITIGGGEPTYQPAFTLDLIRRCKALDIHTALDTCGHTMNRQGVKALQEADLLLYDLKCMDTEEHRSDTGVRNDIILENLARMADIKKDIIIRVPLIPGHTDTIKNIKAMGDFLVRLRPGSVKEIDLLPYHLGGVIKYEMLGREYPLDGSLKPQGDEYLEELRHALDAILGGRCLVRIGG